MDTTRLFFHWTFDSFAPGSIPRAKYNAFCKIHRETSVCFSLLARFEELSTGREMVDWCRVSGLASRLSAAIRDLVDQLQIMNPVEFMDAHDWVAKLSFYTRLSTEHSSTPAHPPYLLMLGSEEGKSEYAWVPQALTLQRSRPALIVTPSLYQYFIEANDLRDKLDALLRKLDLNNKIAAEELGGKAQALIRAGTLPQRLRANLRSRPVELAPAGNCWNLGLWRVLVQTQC
jgi:Pyruvate phosphate dikinase, PEP/pyruvate binding domain.